jgi:hypothetical protein
MKKFILIVAFAFSLLSIVSCEGPGLIVGAQLSTPVYERPGAPGPDYIWIDGDWVVENGNYVWHEGYWSRPRGHRAWQAGNWEQRNNGWSWRRGRWH